MSNIALSITLLKCFAFFRLPPALRKLSWSDLRVSRVLSSDRPLTDKDVFKSDDLMWHHKQQCRPTVSKLSCYIIF